MSKKIVIFGAGGHAKVVADIVKQQGLYEIASFVAEAADTARGVRAEKDLPGLGVSMGIVAVGDNWFRGELVKKISRDFPGFQFVTAVHPRACVAPSATIGEGSVVMPGVVVGPDAKVGAHCILNTNAALDHDSVMDEFSSLAPGAVCGGQVHIGAFAVMGLNSGAIHKVKVGAHTVVGSGSIVVKDLPAQAVAYGVPCRVVKTREPGSRYL